MWPVRHAEPRRRPLLRRVRVAARPALRELQGRARPGSAVLRPVRHAGRRRCGRGGVAGSPVPAPTRADDAVRKTVTVLFADLGGSTGFGERTDPEVARQVLARYHALLQDAIDAHGGTVAKFMGDGMMATFGIPEIAEDDAERAVRAGIDIQDRFEQFAADVAARYGETLTARVGINTGEVVIAAGDADLVGDALNVAARLEKACRPGHVLVGDETWRITRGELAYEPLGEVTVAGRAQPVGTYEVATSESATAEPVAPFVGRDAELAPPPRRRSTGPRTEAVGRARDGAGLAGARQDPPVARAGRRRGADDDATTFEIRCDRAGGSTFAPIADLVRDAAGLEDADGDERRCGHPGAHRRVPRASTTATGPASSTCSPAWSAPRRPGRSRRRSGRSGAPSSRWPSRRPLVVVIDDIQWAEPKLLDLLEHLAEWVTDAPVLLVCLARPELRELRPALAEAGRRVADVLALDGLDSRATEELAAGLLGSALPRELVDRLPVSTDGNPLFVRELVRMLVDDAVIRRRDDGTWELAIDAEAVEVPPTIQSLLAARVERLPADELRVLELASVVGAEFSVGALRELGGDDVPIPTLLERLRRKELVEPTGTYWGDEPIHRFHHVLIRDAAYRRLLEGITRRAAPARRRVDRRHVRARHRRARDRDRVPLRAGAPLPDRARHRRRRHRSARPARRRAAPRRRRPRALDRDDLASAGALARRALAVLPAADADDSLGRSCSWRASASSRRATSCAGSAARRRADRGRRRRRATRGLGGLLPGAARRAHRSRASCRRRTRSRRPRPGRWPTSATAPARPRRTRCAPGCSRGSVGSARPRRCSTSRSARPAPPTTVGGSPRCSAPRRRPRCSARARWPAPAAAASTSCACSASPPRRRRSRRRRCGARRCWRRCAAASTCRARCSRRRARRSRSSACATGCSRPTCSPAWSS